MSDDFAKGATGPSQVYTIGQGPLDVLPAGLVAGQSASPVPTQSAAWITGDYKVSAVAADHTDASGGFWLICDGTGISGSYAALIALVGATRPDSRGRALVMHGSNNASLTDDGVSETNRHGLRHRHTPHTHTQGINDTNIQVGAGIVSAYAASAPAQSTGSKDGGSGVATDPLDGGAFLVPGNLFIHT